MSTMISSAPFPLPSGIDAHLPWRPWRLSGVVVGVLLNDPAALAALGEAVHAAPYKAPPKAPVLYFKPRNTLARSGSAVMVPADAGEVEGTLEVGATLGLVIARTACRVAASQAMAHVAGALLLADLCLSHDSFYRPSVRLRARDGSCLLGPHCLPLAALPALDTLVLTTAIDGRPVHTTALGGMQRQASQLLQDVTEFMTLHPGDILLLGSAAGAPRASAGQRITISAPGFEPLEGRLVAEHGSTQVPA